MTERMWTISLLPVPNNWLFYSKNNHSGTADRYGRGKLKVQINIQRCASNNLHKTSSGNITLHVNFPEHWSTLIPWLEIYWQQLPGLNR